MSNPIPPGLDPVSPWFWDIVERAARNKQKLREILMGMEREEIRRFQREFVEAAVELTDEPFLEHMDPDESEDGAQDISNYVVSQGRERYLHVLQNPSAIPKHVDLGEPTNLSGVAGNVFEERFGERFKLH
jgi:hypothetical protein